MHWTRAILNPARYAGKFIAYTTHSLAFTVEKRPLIGEAALHFAHVSQHSHNTLKAEEVYFLSRLYQRGITAYPCDLSHSNIDQLTAREITQQEREQIKTVIIAGTAKFAWMSKEKSLELLDKKQ